MDNCIGKLLDDRYEILERIGSGGMAVVYKALDHRLNRLVAIKILKEELSGDADFRRRFYAESQAVAMLSHPNIVNVYDVSHSENLDFIVMELIDGISLKEYLEQKEKLNWREALHFSTQIAKALEHAHGRGIIHRDIKPHNIMILKDGSVKVADFGIARVTSAQNTLTREALGSVHYISPEQAKGARVDCRADLYSLGVVMYEMMVGRPPYDAETPVGVAIQHISGVPIMPRELEPSIPVGLEQITMHAMSASLSTRYATASRLVHDLEEFRKDPNVTFDFSHEQEEIDVQRLINDPTYLPTGLGRSSTVRKRPREKQQETAQKQERVQQDTHHRSRLAVAAGTVCIVLAVLLLLYFLYIYFISDLFRKTEEVTVPNFIGSYLSDIDFSKYPNFTFDTSDRAESSEYDAGRVMEQTPKAQRTVKVGTTIHLTISAGASDVLMPNVINFSRQNAQASLNALPIRLNIAVEERVSEIYTVGYVMDTAPSYGSVLTEGQTVTLIVSTGPDLELKTVPALVGEDVDIALAKIRDAGLERGSLRYDESDQPSGTVIFQSITAGEQVREGTVINLRVSKGPEQAQTPNIQMLSTDQEVLVDQPLSLFIQAKTDDGGILRYAWYMSMTGSMYDAELVSRSSENNVNCMVDTSKAGTYYYFCTVENTLNESKASVDSLMIRVDVIEPVVERTVSIEVLLPSAPGVYIVSATVDGEQQVAPFPVETEGSEEHTVTIQVTGSGVSIVEILIGGEVYETHTIDFSAEG